MNATIQEIEGIDDYWGPAFRSVYEGEGHEAFVQQLDERIVQHDKEIEKLCNFHYQPKKRKRQRGPRKPIKSASVSEGSVEDHSQKATKHHHSRHDGSHHQHGHNATAKHYNLSDDVVSSYGSNNRCGPKKRRIDPSRLGGYSDVFPKPGSTMEVNDKSTNPHNTHLDALPDLNEDSDHESYSYDGYTDGTQELDDDIGAKENWEVASTGTSYCEEYEEIAKFHAAAEQLKQGRKGESDVNSTSDLRLYLRNRNRRRDASVERDHDGRRSMCERQNGQIRNISERHIDQSRKASADRQRGRSRGIPDELPPRCSRDRSDCGTTNRDASTDHQGRSRRDAFDRHHGQSHHDSAERQNNESRNVSANLQGRRDGDASGKRQRRGSCDEPANSSRIVFVESQQSYDESTHNPPRPAKNEPDVNSSSDLRSYLRSKLAEVEDKVAGKGARRRRLNRDKSNGHKDVHVSRDASSRDIYVHDSSFTVRQHSQSNLESKRHLGQIRPSSAKPNTSQRRHDSTERYHGESRHASAEHHPDKSRPSSAKPSISQSRHDSTERYHDKSRHASAENHLGESRASSAKPNISQSRHESTERYHGESRHASAEHHLGQSRPSSAKSNISQSRHESTERYHGESRHASAEHHLGQSRPSSAKLNISQSRHNSTERYHGDSRHASAEHHLGQSRPSSGKPNISQSRHESTERYHGESHHASAEHHLGQSRPSSAKSNISQSRHDSTERYHGDSRHASAEHHLGQSRPSSGKPNINQSCYESTERYHGESHHASAEHHLGKSRPSSAKPNISQSRHDSTEPYHGDSRHASAEHHLFQNRLSSAEPNISQSCHDPTKRYHGESLPLSTERQDRNHALPAAVIHNQARPLSAEHSQNRYDTTERYRSQSRQNSIKLCHGKTHHASAGHHSSLSRPLSAEDNISQSCHDSTERYRSQSRHKSIEHCHSQSSHASPGHHLSRPSSAEDNISQTCHDSTERFRSLSRRLYADHNNSQSRHYSTELYHAEKISSAPSSPSAQRQHGRSHASAEVDYNRSRPFSAEHNIIESCYNSTELYHGERSSLSSDRHQSQSRHEPTELYHGESRQRSAEYHLSQIRHGSTELYHAENFLSAECQHDLRIAHSTDVEHKQSRLLSAEHRQSCHDFTGCFRRDIRPVPADHHISQSNVDTIELFQGEDHHTPAELHLVQGYSLSVQRHINQSRQEPTEHHPAQNHGLSTEVKLSQNRPSSSEHHMSQSRLLSIKHHSGESSHLSVDHNDDKNRFTLAQTLRDSTECHHSKSFVMSDEHQSPPITVETHHNRSHHVSAELRRDQSRPLSAEVDHRQSCHASTELYSNSSKSDAQTESIITSTKSEETSRNATSDVTADVDFGRSNDNPYVERHCSSEPDKENVCNNDSRCRLRSYLKSKFTCHREACAALPNSRSSSSEHSGHSREASAESRHSQVERRIELNRAASAETVIVHLGLVYDNARRQCSTPEPDMKRELINKSTVEVANDLDESASVSINLSTGYHPNQSYNEPKLLCPSNLPETSVKIELKENSSNSGTSSQHASPGQSEKVFEGILPQRVLQTIYSKRHPRQKHDASTKIPFGPDTKEHQKIADDGQPPSKECKYNLLVRDVESINQSTLLLPSETRNSPLNAAVTSRDSNACERVHSDAFTEVSAVSVRVPSDREVVSESDKQQSNSLKTAVNIRDPRLQPRNSCSASAERLNCFIEPDAQSEANGKVKPESNINSSNEVISSRDPRLRPRHGCETDVHKENLDKLVKSLPNFDPSNKSQSISAWISKVDEIALSSNWTDQQVVEYAMPKLVGSAKRWYEGFTSNLSWHEWQNKLVAAFPCTENYGKMLLDMLNKTAKVGDSLEHYYFEKISMLNKCSIRGKKSVECIVFGIEDETVRTRVEAENFDQPDKLLEFLKKNNNGCALNMEIIYNDLIDNP